MSDETQQPIRATPVKFCGNCSIPWEGLEGEGCHNCNSINPPVIGLFTEADAELILRPTELHTVACPVTASDCHHTRCDPPGWCQRSDHYP
jgi:hypothetical protein